MRPLRGGQQLEPVLAELARGRQVNRAETPNWRRSNLPGWFGPRGMLVVRGLIRVYMTSPEGRQVTVRYARAGDLLGIARSWWAG